MHQTGDWQVGSVINGTIRLDGGAMFGVVPRVMWEPRNDVDDLHRILMATRTVLAVNRRAGRIVIVDTGCGPKWTAEKAARFGIQRNPDALVDALAECGATLEDVTDVVISHLHFDHNGGLTDTPPGEDAVRLLFPTATHWVHRGHWEHALAPHRKDRASFLKEDFAALDDAGVVTFLEGEGPDGPMPGWSWRVSHGHTPFQLHPQFGDGGGSVLFAGDIVPTQHHLSPGWVMAYDVRPMTTIEEKLAFYTHCLERRAVLAFPHDPVRAAVTLDGTPSRPEVARQIDL